MNPHSSMVFFCQYHCFLLSNQPHTPPESLPHQTLPCACILVRPQWAQHMGISQSDRLAYFLSDERILGVKWCEQGLSVQNLSISSYRSLFRTFSLPYTFAYSHESTFLYGFLLPLPLLPLVQSTPHPSRITTSPTTAMNTNFSNGLVWLCANMASTTTSCCLTSPIDRITTNWSIPMHNSWIRLLLSHHAMRPPSEKAYESLSDVMTSA